MLKFSICIIFLSFFVNLFSREVQKDVFVRYKQEKVNGAIFLYRVDVIDGKRSETFMIDGKKTEEGDYLDSILEAEKIEKRMERENERSKFLKNFEVKEKSQKKILKKLLNLNIEKLEVQIKKLQNSLLKNFFVFSNKSIASQEDFIKIESELLVKSKELSVNDIESFESDLAKIIIKQLEESQDNLEALLQDSIKNAIDNSDDTQLLKSLLDL